MGGRAFLQVLQDATFPRLDPQTYQALRARHLEQLQLMFHLVGVPREAPEKNSHGDLDYVVCSPVDRLTRPEDIEKATGATNCIVDGRTLNLAIPLQSGGMSTFYQVDINRCHDPDEWERTIVFQSYGDLGMIIGLLARENGLSLGLHGLKVPHAPKYNMEPFVLSTSFPRIFEFFGFDFAMWQAGFTSRQSAFQWVASSRWFNTLIFKESLRREHRRKDREMYQEFLEWVRYQREDAEERSVGTPSTALRTEIVEEAKVFFQKQQEYDNLVAQERKRREAKDKFNGHLVMEWTGLRGRSVKVLMDEVRKSLDEEMMERVTREEIRAFVLEAQEKIALFQRMPREEGTIESV